MNEKITIEILTEILSSYSPNTKNNEASSASASGIDVICQIFHLVIIFYFHTGISFLVIPAHWHTCIFFSFVNVWWF